MHKLIFILMLLGSSYVNAQDTLNSKIVEERSYKLYQDGKWEELISFGKEALKNDLDYYYLRMRIGIAYYSKQNYREAQKQFWKAYQFNLNEDLLMEYLYYCYIYSGKYDEARKCTKLFSPVLAEKIKSSKRPLIDYLLLEGGIKCPAISELSNAGYGQFGIGHSVGKNISFFHAVTYFEQNSIRTDLNQTQYYLSSNVPVKRSWLISPAFHYLQRTITYNPPPDQPHPSGPMHPPPLPPPPSVKSYFIGSLSIKRSISKFDIGVGSTVSNIDSIRQVQGNLFLTYFPMGNTKWSFTSLGCMQKEDISIRYRLAFSESASATLHKKLILTGSYFYNEAHHISEMNGYIADNSPDLTTSRFSIMSSFLVSRHASIYFMYQFENKTRNNFQNNTSTNYSCNNFIGGIKFIL